MKKRLKQIVSVILPLLLGVFLVYFAYSRFTDEQLYEVRNHVVNADYRYVGIATLFSVLSVWGRAYRWNFALKYMGYRPSTRLNVMAISIGYLMNLTLPRSGEFSRALVLQKYQGVPFDKSFGSIVSERVIDLICLLGIVVLALGFQYEVLKGFLLHRIPVPLLLYIGVLSVFVVVLVGVWVWKSNWKLLLVFKQKVRGLVEGVVSIFKMPYKKGFFACTLLIWGGYILTFYFGIFALEATSSMSFGMVMAAFVAGSFAITFTNGGFGAFPLLISELLVLYGISAAAGTSFGWILWTTQTALIVVMGVGALLLLPLMYRKNE